MVYGDFQLYNVYCIKEIWKETIICNLSVYRKEIKMALSAKKKKEILYPLTLIPLSLPPPSHEQALTTFCLYRFPDSGLPYEENHVMCGLL